MWKRKEKELTREEALQLARQELKPYWFNSPPQIAAAQVPAENGGTKPALIPLDEKFDQKVWLLLLVDPTDYSLELILPYAREWHRRYSSHDLVIALVLEADYQFLKVPQQFGPLVESLRVAFPVIVDHDHGLRETLKVESTPAVVLFKGGQLFFQKSGSDWIQQVELDLQKFLRMADPGLSLGLPFSPSEKRSIDSSVLDFGNQKKSNRNQAPLDFQNAEVRGPVLSKKFTEPFPTEFQQGQIFLEGQWLQDHEKIATTDPSASLSFMSQDARCSIVAQSLSKTKQPAIIIVTLMDLPVAENYTGRHLVTEGLGRTAIVVSAPAAYHALSSLPEDKRLVTLRFPEASQNPVCLYGLRFGSD